MFELFYFFIFFQPNHGGGSPNFDLNSLPATRSNSSIPSAPRSPCRCAEHLSRISDLEGQLLLLKRQAKAAIDQAGRSFGLMKQVSSLEIQVYDLMAKIAHLEECDSFLARIIESACEKLQCKFLEAPRCFWLCSCILTCRTLYLFSGSCLNPADENRRVAERLEALKRTPSDTNTF
jgi:hypothetical protein